MTHKHSRVATQTLKLSFYWSFDVAAEQVAEKVLWSSFLSEPKDPSVLKTKAKRDSSRKIGAQNDNVFLFSATCEAATHKTYL